MDTTTKVLFFDYKQTSQLLQEIKTIPITINFHIEKNHQKSQTHAN